MATVRYSPTRPGANTTVVGKEHERHVKSCEKWNVFLRRNHTTGAFLLYPRKGHVLPGQGQEAKADTQNILTPQPAVTQAGRCLTILIWMLNVWILWRFFHSLSHFSFKVIPQYTRKVEILFEGKKTPTKQEIYFSVSEKKTSQKIFPYLQ